MTEDDVMQIFQDLVMKQNSFYVLRYLRSAKDVEAAFLTPSRAAGCACRRGTDPWTPSAGFLL